jgi:nitrate/nitrite transport system ATP-binding protein
MDMSKFLSLEGVEKVFPLPGGKEYVAVKDVNVNIRKNEIVSIIGHSGCGKSTLLNMIAGLDLNTAGGIFLNNKEISGPGPERAVVFQNHSLLPWLTVYQNIEMAVKKVMPELSAKALKERVMKFVEMVNLDAAKDKYPGEISGGMKQRVGIAREYFLTNASFSFFVYSILAKVAFISACIFLILVSFFLSIFIETSFNA